MDEVAYLSEFLVEIRRVADGPLAAGRTAQLLVPHEKKTADEFLHL